MAPTTTTAVSWWKCGGSGRVRTRGGGRRVEAVGTAASLSPSIDFRHYI